VRKLGLPVPYCISKSNSQRIFERFNTVNPQVFSRTRLQNRVLVLEVRRVDFGETREAAFLLLYHKTGHAERFCPKRPA
jgi:hypothetical protein